MKNKFARRTRTGFTLGETRIFTCSRFRAAAHSKFASRFLARGAGRRRWLMPSPACAVPVISLAVNS